MGGISSVVCSRTSISSYIHSTTAPGRKDFILFGAELDEAFEDMEKPEAPPALEKRHSPSIIETGSSGGWKECTEWRFVRMSGMRGN